MVNNQHLSFLDCQHFYWNSMPVASKERGVGAGEMARTVSLKGHTHTRLVVSVGSIELTTASTVPSGPTLRPAQTRGRPSVCQAAPTGLVLPRLLRWPDSECSCVPSGASQTQIDPSDSTVQRKAFASPPMSIATTARRDPYRDIAAIHSARGMLCVLTQAGPPDWCVESRSETAKLALSGSHRKLLD